MNVCNDQSYVLERSDFPSLLGLLQEQGYEIVAPGVRDGAIVYDTMHTVEDLPVGWTDEQAPGRYGLTRRSDDALFGYALGPDSWKRHLHPPRRRLWRATKSADALSFAPELTSPKKKAFLGVRACELEAIKVQDKVLQDGPYSDHDYATRRKNALIIAVNCGAPSATCFCTSMGTGPEAQEGYDMALTEMYSQKKHQFLVTAGSKTGAALLEKLPVSPAPEDAINAAKKITDATANTISRRLETNGLKEFLQDNPEHPQWNDVADRCLSCGNCSSVCPTCFCTTTEDRTSLDGAESERVQRWDSCFTAEFSELSGGSVRKSTKSRYRQWMTHKLSTWIDQFGVSGCVGCGRCIAWCPVGIDITEEARVMRAIESKDHEVN